MRSTTDANKLWVVALNKTSSAVPATIVISNGAAYNLLKAYNLVAGNINPQPVGTYKISGGPIGYLMPPYSVTTMELSTAGTGTEPALPAIPSQDTTPPAAPTNIRVH